MHFKKWFNESVVEFNKIQEAIKKSLEFINVGEWRFEPTYHGMSGVKTTGISGWYRKNEGSSFFNDKGSFFVSVHVILKNQETYDSISGVDNNQNKLEFISSVLTRDKNNRFKKIGEKNNVKEPIIRTPYQLALWVKQVIDNYDNNDDDNDNDNDGDDNVYDPTPSSNQLVSV